MKVYKVYKHTCPNGKVYIGITGQNEKLRWNYGNGYGTQLFGRAIKKYGWQNIKHEIVHVCKTLEEAYETESRLISEHDATNKKRGYNCSSGGAGAKGHKISESSKEIIREKNIAKWRDKEYREKMVKHLRKISDENKGKSRSKVATAKTIAKTSKMVDQYTLDGEYVATHKSLMDAARCVNQKSNSNISSCCKGKAMTAHGYIWKYSGDAFDYNEYLQRKTKWEMSAMATAKRNADRNKKAVRQIDEQGKTVKTFKSAADAERETGIRRTSIYGCCKGRLKHAGGYVWEIAN